MRGTCTQFEASARYEALDIFSRAKGGRSNGTLTSPADTFVRICFCQGADKEFPANEQVGSDARCQYGRMRVLTRHLYVGCKLYRIVGHLFHCSGGPHRLNAASSGRIQIDKFERSRVEGYRRAVRIREILSQGNCCRTHFGGDNEDLFGDRGLITLIESRKPLSVRRFEEEFLLLHSARDQHIALYRGDFGMFKSSDGSPRGAVRCVARGNIIAIASTREETEARRAIIHEARNSMDFYWSRDRQWPFAEARMALISPPRGGFPTSYAVDPVPKPR